MRRPKGLGTVEKVGNGFRARKTINGLRVCGTVRKSRAEAMRDLDGLRAPDAQRDEMPTLKDYAEELLRGSYKKRVRRSTWETSETIWRVHLSGTKLGRMKLDKIRRKDVQEFVDDLQGSPSWVRRIGAFMSKALSSAVEDGLIAVNPAFHVRYPEVEERENRTLAPQEAVRVLNPRDRLGAMILVAAHTGLRRGELCGLHWEDVKGSSVHVRRAIATLRGGCVETKVKSKTSMASVPLTPEALAAIQAQPKRGKYVFSVEDGGPVSPHNLSRDWKGWAERNGLEGMRLHDLRGSYVSLLIEQGEDIRTVQELARHADARTTLKLYARSRAETKAAAVEKLRAAIVPSTGNNPADTSQDRTQVA